MSTANINVRVDSQLKKDAESLFADLGLNMSTAVTMFLRSAVSYDGIPFEITRRKPNAETIQAINDAMEGKNLYGPFNSVEEMMEALDADD